MKIGCLILAGGLGTRLGHKGPKGSFVFQGKPLFEHILDRCGDAPIASMTSHATHEKTVEYFVGRDVAIFQQESLPLLDGEGIYPNGNGKALSYFYNSPCFKDWQEQGIDYLSVMPIDNPLVEPLDYSDGTEDLIVKVVKTHPGDKLGRVQKGKTLTIKEYFETKEETDFGFTGFFACSFDWIKRVANVELPEHKIEKLGHHHIEYFIFDLFPFAKNYKLIEIDRKKSFHPIKTLKDV